MEVTFASGSPAVIDSVEEPPGGAPADFKKARCA